MSIKNEITQSVDRITSKDDMEIENLFNYFLISFKKS